MRGVGAIALVLCACPSADFRFGDGGQTDAGGDAGAPDAGLPCGGCGGLASLHCDLDAGACVECFNNAHCKTPYDICDGATHRCVECLNSTDCTMGLVCESTTHHCGTKCTQALECLPSATHCGTGGICGTCDDQNDCNGGLHCEVTTAQCVECAQDSDCPGDRHLCDRDLGKCVQCLTSADCESGKLCDPQMQQCTGN